MILDSISNPIKNSIENSIITEFNPLMLSGCILWIHALRSPKTFNGSDITQINDLSGHFNHLAQPISVDQPLYVKNVVNGLPVMRFDGVSDFFNFTSNITDSSVTISIVYQSTNTTIGGSLVANSSDVSFYLQKGGAGEYQCVDFVSAGAFDTGAGVFRVATNVINTPSSMDVYFDGSLVNSGNPNLTMDMGLIGKRPVNIHFTGDIPEIIIYNRPLTAPERIKLDTYLITEYGI